MLRAWSGHFCLTPHVAIRIGLSHHTRAAFARGAWRTVSEDPAKIWSIVRLRCLPFAFIAKGKPHQPLESIAGQVLLSAHRSNDRCEPAEVFSLHDEWMTLEERKDVSVQIPQRIDGDTSTRCCSGPSVGVDRTQTKGSVLRAPLDTSGAGRRGRPGEVATRPSTEQSGFGVSRRRSNPLRRRIPSPNEDRARAST